MRKLGAWVAGIAIAGLTSLASAATYPGNGNTGFGGPIGQGSLSLTDNGTTVSGTLTKGGGGFNDVLVLYIDSVSGGFSDTSSFSDANDGLRKAISGFDGTNRSTLTFPAGFTADYALALGPSSDNFGGEWQLVSGGNNSLPFVASANLSPTGTNGAASYSFNFTLASIGNPSSFQVFGTYIANSGYRSDEFIAGNGTGPGQGYNPFVGTSSGAYAVPEPSSAAILLLGAAGLLGRFRKGR
jgi:hypothetical protein